MTKDMWLVVRLEEEYSEEENCFYISDYYRVEISEGQKVLFMSEEEATKEAIEMTRIMFSLCSESNPAPFETSFLSKESYEETHCYRCFDEIWEVIKEVPIAVSEILDTEALTEEEIVDLFPRIVSKIQNVVIEKKDPCYESLLDSLSRNLYMHYTAIERIPERSWGGEIREEVERLHNKKKELEIEIAALMERKKMVEALY